ncbi:ferredoxin [Clostridiales Family XIII bacterium PM5-7]
MQMNNIVALYFSPTRNTKKVVTAIGESIASQLGLSLSHLDITLPASRLAMQEFQKDTLVLVGFPIYAGRIPNKLLPYLQEKIAGSCTLAIPVVTFGNRSYGDGLTEIRNELDANGCLSIAGAAVPAQHGFSALLATGRPNDEDISQLQKFGTQIADKLMALTEAPTSSISFSEGNEVAPYYTPLGLDGKPTVFLKAKPKTDPIKCNYCGRCPQVCPMGSIPMEDPHQVNGICIKCQACIKTCPTGAKYFDDEAFLSHVKMLEHHYAKQTTGAFFL